MVRTRVIIGVILIVSHCLLYLKGRHDGAFVERKDLRKHDEIDELAPHIKQLNNGISPVAEAAHQPGHNLNDGFPEESSQSEHKHTELPEIVELENYRSVAGEKESADQVVDEGNYSEGMPEKPVKHEEDFEEQE